MSSDDDPPTSTNAHGGGKQSLEIGFDKLFRNGDDEPAANIVVVSSADRCNRKPRRKSTENDSNSSSFADESLSQKSDVELKLLIERYDKSFSSLSRTLPDKGLKIKLERERVQAELDRRSLVRKTTRVPPDAASYLNKTKESCGPDRVLGDGVEMHDEAAKAVEEEPKSGDSSYRAMSSPVSKKQKRDQLADAVNKLVDVFSDYVKSKSKEIAKPLPVEVHEVVKNVDGIPRQQVMRVARRFINGPISDFEMLKSLPDNDKLEWISLCLE